MAGMQCSGGTERNGMKRYCGYGSPTERRKRPCEDEERDGAIKIAVPSFTGTAVFVVAVLRRWNGGRPILLLMKKKYA